jgi:hypothetical protein
MERATPIELADRAAAIDRNAPQLFRMRLLDGGGGQSGLEDNRPAVDPDAKAFWADAKSDRAQR